MAAAIATQAIGQTSPLRVPATTLPRTRVVVDYEARYRTGANLRVRQPGESLQTDEPRLLRVEGTRPLRFENLDEPFQVIRTSALLEDEGATETPEPFGSPPREVEQGSIPSMQGAGTINSAPAPRAPFLTNEAPAPVVAPPAEFLPAPVAPQISAPSADRVSLHLNNVDVREALEMISRSHGLNILVAPNVTGPVTANFENVPLEAALAGILRLCRLAATYEGDLIFVYTAGEAPAEDVHLRVFTLDYASAIELKPAVEGLLTEGGQAFISQITPTNNRQTKEAIVVSDVLPALTRVEEYILYMDQPPKQVMIEAHVLEVVLSDDLRHGVNFQHMLAHRLKINLTGMASETASPALFAEIDSSDVNALVECLQTTADAKTLASPRIMVVNGQKARIQVGEQLGFKVVTVTETTAIENVKFLEIGVVLEVTPQMTRDHRVLMRVRPKVSSGKVDPNTLLPEEQTRELETDVLLLDGQGVVIGGLIQEKDSTTRKKIPWLGDLYLVGKLFQRTELNKARSEIVITMVPRIIDCGPPCTERDAMDAERSQMPLFDGPLCRLSRPEPSMPDPVRHPGPWIPRLK